MKTYLYNMKRNSHFEENKCTISVDDDSSDDQGSIKDKPKPKSKVFSQYDHLFQNLLKTTNVPTIYPIVNCNINFDSTRAILVVKKSE